MNKENELTLIIFKELLSRNIHGMDKETIKEIYKEAEKIKNYIYGKDL